MLGSLPIRFFFLFKQKTAYELRISDWSSDVCSSDLPARETYNMNASGSPLGAIFAGIDRVLRLSDPLRPRGRRQKAIETAMDFVKERLNGEDGLGGIFPAMANAAMAFHVLGSDWTDPHYTLRTERESGGDKECQTVS